MSADRNLLFGLLAIQCDFVGRDAVLAGLRAWQADRSRSLGEILMSGGACTASQRHVLDQLVEAHVQAHGGEVRQSLAAFSAASSLKQAIHRLGDAELEGSLVSLGAARSTERIEATLDYAPAGLEQGPGEREVPRFRILRPHAKGGLGEVFVAEDTELQREVALKEIQPRHADDLSSRSRFLLEAEITGKLEHPGIVPVYSLGHYPDGRPYYAMRFIRGHNLKEAIRQFHEPSESVPEPRFDSVEFRQLLRRFLDVCNAVAYAHSRGVLHRDLKPGNVMLGRYGETLVVDWGLAKVSDVRAGEVFPVTPASDETMLRASSGSGVDPTQVGSALGTPSYMSPEQAAGRLDQLGPASDVYSLGATLYTVLTNQPPVEGANIAEILRRVQQGAITWPRELRRDVPVALNAICRKAMAREPSGRYSAALDLAADLEHWLADEPVSAYREPWRARFRRWRRRNPGLVASALTGLVVTGAALAAVTVALSAKNRALADANAAERRAKLEAQQNSARAEANFAKAEQNFTLARQAVQDMLADVGIQELADVPKQDAVRRRLIERALAFHQKFLDERQHDPEFRTETAEFMLQSAQFRLRLGRSEESLQQTRESLAIAEELAQKRPDDAKIQSLLGTAWSTLGWSRYIAGAANEAEAAYRKSLEAYARLDRPRAEPDRAFVLKNLGILLRNTGRMAEAEAIECESVDLHQKIVGENPSFIARYHLAAAHNNLGNLFGQTRRFDEALEQHGRARELRDGLHRERPEDTAVQSELAMSYDNLAILHHYVNHRDESAAAFQEAERIAGRLRLQFPERIDYAAQYGRICMNRADALRNFGQPDQALELLEQATVALQAARAQDPQHGPTLRWLANALGVRAEIHFSAERWEQAMVAWDEVTRLDAGPLTEVGKLLGVVCRARLGRHAEVGAAAEELQKEDAVGRLLAGYGKNARFDLACALAISSVAAAGDAALTADERKTIAESYTKRAIQLLRECFQAGDLKPDSLLRGLSDDKDLEALRPHADFQNLLQSVRGKRSPNGSPQL